jgi:ABC-type cobalamin/Fe3+-siderophores transport system ATPase subunit
MISQIKIERFKSIESVTLDLAKINVLVGANNSGKSSILQALQFATSVAQTAKLYTQGVKFDKHGVWATSVYPDQLIYSPVKDPYALAKGGVLKEDIEQCMAISFCENEDEQVLTTFRKGKNKNIAARFEGQYVGEHLASLEKPFCMYVPGLAGIPFEEEIRTVALVRKIAAKGDSNTVFRNVINLLRHDESKWELFLKDLKDIFPGIELEVKADPNTNGYVDVKFRLTSSSALLPIDLAGTGVLQAIQIAAYVNYFQPALLLLDEPDSHLHPDNQRALASLLVSLADRTETTIIVSTHSRHLMSALHEDAKFFLMKNGTISDSEYNHYIGLLELGALDEYDYIKNGDLKYIILTEDSSLESRKYLRGILEGSGYSKDEFQIYSYNSVSQIDSAKMFASFLLDINPNLKVIIYRDRDGLYDDEIQDLQQKIEFDPRVKCVVAYFNDIEMYYCNTNHIVTLCHSLGLVLAEQEAALLIDEAMEEVEEESRRKFYNHRMTKATKAREDCGQAMIRAENSFATNKAIFAYGKKVAGLVKAKLQHKFGQNIDIYQPTANTNDSYLIAIHQVA